MLPAIAAGPRVVGTMVCLTVVLVLACAHRLEAAESRSGSLALMLMLFAVVMATPATAGTTQWMLMSAAGTADALHRAIAVAGVEVRAYFMMQHRGLQAGVLATFALVNALRIFSYIPQIVRAARDRNGASAISCATWTFFLFSHLITAAYSLGVSSWRRAMACYV